MGMPRKIVQIAGDMAALFALADEGSAWILLRGEPWHAVAALPEAEACGVRARDIEGECRLPKGHRDHHWSGGRKWA